MQGLEQFADTYTQSSLKAGPTPERLAKLTNKIKLVADSNIEEAHRHGPAVACVKGCAHCCHQFVTALIPEVLALATYIKVNFDEGHRRELHQRIDAYLVEMRKVPPGERSAKLKATCPLLENDLCSAFSARPMTCRMFNSINVESCKLYRFTDGASPGRGNAKQIEATNALLFGSAIGLRRAGLQEAIVELIPALQIALSTDNAAERYLAGEPIFDDVIVAGYDPSVVKSYLR